jgi:hypothetical protein
LFSGKKDADMGLISSQFVQANQWLATVQYGIDNSTAGAVQ